MCMSYIDIFECSHSTSIGSLRLQYQLWWWGLMLKKKDYRIPKQFLYGELDKRKRLEHKAKLNYKDYIKNTLEKANIMQND